MGADTTGIFDETAQKAANAIDAMQQASTALAVRRVADSREGVAAPSGLTNLSPAQMRDRLDQYRAAREDFRQWVFGQMVEGTHYGFPPGCEAHERMQGNEPGYVVEGKWHSAKQWKPRKSLYKAGADFICDLLMIQPRFEMSDTAWRQLGEKAGIVAVQCRLIKMESPFFPHFKPGDVVGEGIGAAEVGRKRRDANGALKVAQKSAKVDAVINTMGWSDMFTQDAEDQAKRAARPGQAENAPTAASRQERDFDPQQEVVAMLAELTKAWKAANPGKGKEEFYKWAAGVNRTTRDLHKSDQWTFDMVVACQDALGGGQ